MAALSVENVGSASLNRIPAFPQAVCSPRRKAVLQATPPEAVTHETL
jgi:hypothetical protein